MLAKKYVNKTSKGSISNWALNVLVKGGKKMEASDYITCAVFCILVLYNVDI